MPVLIVALASVGLALGSFLNVVAYRLPNGLSLVRPPSHCPRCSHPIRPWYNVPVLGWVLLRGQCHDCGTPISVRYPAVELITGVSYAIAGWWLATTHTLAALPIVLVGITSAILFALFAVPSPRARRPVPATDSYEAARREAPLGEEHR